MARSGTLYWFYGADWKKHVFMFIKARKLPDFAKRQTNEDKYIHTFLAVENKEKLTFHSKTENIEDDSFWGHVFKKIEL